MKNDTDTSSMLWKEVFKHYYPEDDGLRRILLQHSQSVAIKSLQIVSLHPELRLERDFIINACMLHDIGIMKCDAPGICCHGDKPYIQHGILEQLVCYADKFYSKSHLDAEKTIEQARNSLLRFSDEGLKRFDKWVKMFE